MNDQKDRTAKYEIVVGEGSVLVCSYVEMSKFNSRLRLGTELQLAYRL